MSWSEKQKEKYRKSRLGKPLHSEETKQRLREAAIKQFSTKESREKHGTIIKEKMNNPELKLRLSKAQNERFTKPEELAKCASHGFDNKTHSTKTKNQMSESAKKLWEENYDELAERTRKYTLNRIVTPETRKKMSESALKRWGNIEYRENQVSSLMKRLKGNRGKRSYYESKKAGIVYCRSNYERTYYQKLDSDLDILTYEVENFKVRYTFEGKVRLYIPDVTVYFHKGGYEVREIKPKILLKEKQTIAKHKAAKKVFGDKFRVVTEEEIFC